MNISNSSGLFGGRYFRSAEEAARQYQYEASRRAANSRDVRRFGPMLCASMQRDAAELYAKARDAMSHHGICKE